MEQEQQAQDAPKTQDVAVAFQEIGTDEQVSALYFALGQARPKFTRIEKNKEVTITPRDKPKYTFKYAELDESLTATIPALAEHGLTVLQPYSGGAGHPDVVRTIIAHKDGGRIVTITELPGWNDIKALGSHITYMRRYAYNALLCLAADSDADEGPSERESTGNDMRRREPEAPPPKAQVSGKSATTTTARATSIAGVEMAGNPGQMAGNAPQAANRPLVAGGASLQPSEASRTTSPTSNTNTTAQGSTSSPRSSEATSPSPLAPTPQPAPTSSAGSTPPPAPTTAPTGNGSQPASSAAELTQLERSVVSKLCQKAGATNAIQIRALVDKAVGGTDVKLGRANYRAAVVGLLSLQWSQLSGITAEQIGVHLGPEVTPDGVAACLADLETAAAARQAQGG
jgi:hypothetical protein